MRKIKSIIKVIGIAIISVVLLVVIVITLFINFSPQFGQQATNEQKEGYHNSGHYEDGKFVNNKLTVMEINYWRMIKTMAKKARKRRPSGDIPVDKIDSTEIVNHTADTARLTWFGHSAFLLELDGKKILIDPMFGESPSPHPWVGGTRYSKELPIEIEKLPYIDAIILSHDHYDHLDYGSIQKLKSKVGAYYTPLGVGNHLRSWGIDADKVHELNWWDEIKFENIELVCTPARHFSGRGLLDRSTTLWASWVIKGSTKNIFFSGDSGYDDHFKEIGEKYGPFDISLMECGQYNEDWKVIHMMPEQTVQAAIDLKSNLMMPIHWGAFTLAFHDWTDPAERVTKAAAALNMPISTPKIGEVIIVGDSLYPEERWWTEYQ
jgi:L-ascorbate metabolism protein UlaG (beta-lactamase superfamily)